MTGEERLINDMHAQQYTEQSTTLGDLYHELRVALHKYTIGELSLEAYNAKIEETQKFLESMKV